MNKIDCISELRGEYNIKVLEGDRVVYESGWRKNTILANGLSQLYSNDASVLTAVLDLGSSSSLPGTQGYDLQGVVTPASQSEFVNIPRSRHSVTTENLSTRVFYSYFSSRIATNNETVREFAIKSSATGAAFARNVFLAPILIESNQYIILEYRLKINRYHTFTTKLPFKTGSGHTFTVPITGVTYNIPYNEMYRKDNDLLLVKDKTPLPTFGTNWPATPNFAITNRLFSTFKPHEIGHGLDSNTRTYSVSTAYYNISARPYGLHNQINTLILSRKSDSVVSNELVNDKFVAMRVAFPLALYNYENNFFGVNGITTNEEEKTLVLQQFFSTDTDVNIIADSSGSMNSTLTVLNRMVTTGKLKEKLLPFYNNDENLYNQRVRFFNSGTERTFDTTMLNSAGRGGKKLINLVFQDECESSSYNNTNTSTYQNDVIQLQNTIKLFPTGNFIGIVFQVQGFSSFNTFLQKVKSGIDQFASVNLKDNPETKIAYDIGAGRTEEYYVDVIVNALINNNTEIKEVISEIPASLQGSSSIYSYYHYITNSIRYNKFDLYFNYTWREV
jgi:hypothetical protein